MALSLSLLVLWRQASDRLFGLYQRFRCERSATSAVEFALLGLPFITVLLGVLQIGIIHTTQTTLQSATQKAAEYLVNNVTFAPDNDVLDYLYGSLCQNSANVFRCDYDQLQVNIRPLRSVSNADPFTPQVTNFGYTAEPLVLTTRVPVQIFAPGLKELGIERWVWASAIMRQP